MDRKKIVGHLLKWFAHHARDLPWRRTRDPYAIWVSEIMLQQTQVQTVIPYWERWMRALPTVQALARARPERIHKLWEGLGYYCRVRNMQRAAQAIVKEHGGRVPETLEALLELPGIGPYTAGAICSIAFGLPTPILDGNVIRVLARVFAIDSKVWDAAVRGKLWTLAADLVRHAAGTRYDSPCSRFNQALMELGAVVCTPRRPRCGLCPIAKFCAARRQGRVTELPNLAPRPRVTRRRFMAFVVKKRGRLLVRQRPAGAINGHLWEFPNVEVGLHRSSAVKAARAVFGAPVRVLWRLGTVRHSITRYRITLEAFRVAPLSNAPITAGVWLDRRKLNQLAFASAHKKLLQGLSGTP